MAPLLEFTPPPPGTYALQRIQPVADAILLDSAGRPTKLSAVTMSKITLLTFFYTYCADPLGCPFAYRTLTEVRSRVLRDAGLARQVRFVSVSVERASDGAPRRTVHHMLQMFLIDRHGVIREIHTLAYLQPAVILNDIRTLFLEEGA